MDDKQYQIEEGIFEDQTACSPSVNEETRKKSPSEEDTPLESTYLGDAIDSLMMHWCQLLTNVSVRAPVPPPSTLDHVKEVAEVCSKHFRDAVVDVTNEFYRIGVQWEIEEFEEAYEIEEKELDEAILRQETLIAKAREVLKKRATDYSKQFPNAGKHFTT